MVNGLASPPFRQGGFTRSATRIVVANDASSLWLYAGDYFCDGTDDDIQIQAAIDDLPTLGGKIILSDGNFSTGAALSILGSRDNVLMIGQGRDATRIKLANSKNVNVLNIGDQGATAQVYAYLAHITIDGNGTNQTSGNCIKVDYGTFVTVYDTSIVSAKNDGIQVTGAAAKTSQAVIIADSIIASCSDWGVEVLSNGPFVQLFGNKIHSNGTTGSGNGGVNLVGSENLVGFNDFYNNKDFSLRIYSSSTNLVGLNRFVGVGRIHISVESASHHNLIGLNYLESAGEDADNTYPMIRVRDASTANNAIIANFLNGSATDIATYAIDEQNTANTNYFIYNVITGTWTNTATINAIGAATVVQGNIGHKTENSVLSGTFAIDSTGVKTVTVAHGLPITPAARKCILTVIEDTNVDDWAFNLLKVESTDGTNVVAKINVSTASATGGATAKLGLVVVSS